MGSLEAMDDGSKDRYFQDAEDDIKKLVPEGIVGRVSLQGACIRSTLPTHWWFKSRYGFIAVPKISKHYNRLSSSKSPLLVSMKVIHTMYTLLERRLITAGSKPSLLIIKTKKCSSGGGHFSF